jgi:hypothetical protein
MAADGAGGGSVARVERNQGSMPGPGLRGCEVPGVLVLRREHGAGKNSRSCDMSLRKNRF